MAVNKNFVVKHGLEVGDLLVYANVTDSKVGIGSTIPRDKLDVRGGIAATHATVTGVTTVQTALRVGSGIGGTIFTALDENVVGVGISQPLFLLHVASPVASGSTAFYVKGDARLTGDLDVGAGVSITGLSTFVGVGTFYEGFISAGIATINQLEVLGFSTFRSNLDIASDVGITSTLVVGAGLSVAGISTFTGLADLNGGLNVTGLADLNGGLDVTGIATFANNVDINADVDIQNSLVVNAGTSIAGVSTFSSNVDVNADLDISQSLTVSNGTILSGVTTISNNVDINADVDIQNSLVVNAGTSITGVTTLSSDLIVDGTSDLDELNVSGLSTFSSNVDINSDVDINRSLSIGGGIGITGIGTIGRVKILNDGTGGIITATTGIITYYGDGSQLASLPLTGVGIATETAVIGTGITQIDFIGAGISFASANESAGISTIHFSGGREETVITKEEFTATSGQTVFNLATPYDSGYIDVYQEGSKLFSGDFTETDSTTITLTTGATVGDKLQFVNYEKVALNEINPIWRNDGASGGIYTFTTVGVGTSATTAFFDVYGGMLTRAGVVTVADSASSDILRITDGGVNIVSGLTTVGTNLHVTGDLNIDGTGTHDIFGTISLDNVAVAAGVTIGQTLEVNGDGHSIDGTTTLENVNATGIVTANSVVLSQNLTVNNDALIQGNLTVNGTTTILDTVVQEVDLLNIQANGSTPAIGVTQSGSGDIAKFFDSTTAVFTIADGGNTTFSGAIDANGDGHDISNNISLEHVTITGITSATNLIEIRSDDGTAGRSDYYCESSNAHYTRVQSAPHSQYSGNVTAILPTVSGDFIVGDTASDISQNIRTSGGINAGLAVTASSFVKSGGTSSEFLKADGSVDSNTYVTSADTVSTGKAIAMAMIFG